MKVLYFGGAFNPPTKAHIALADHARKQLAYDKVLFMPTKYEYVRYDEGKDFVYSDEKRLEMLSRIAADHEWMIVSDYEMNQPSQPRTYHTLQHFSDQYELKLLIGSDWLRRLETGWNYVMEICRDFGLAVMARNGDDVQEIIEHDPYLKALQPYLTIVQMPDEWQNVSSTAVRRAVMMKKEAEALLRHALPEEITEEDLDPEG